MAASLTCSPTTKPLAYGLRSVVVAVERNQHYLQTRHDQQQSHVLLSTLCSSLHGASPRFLSSRETKVTISLTTKSHQDKMLAVNISAQYPIDIYTKCVQDWVSASVSMSDSFQLWLVTPKTERWFLTGSRDVSGHVCVAKTWSVPNPNQVVFVPKPRSRLTFHTGCTGAPI